MERRVRPAALGDLPAIMGLERRLFPAADRFSAALYRELIGGRLDAVLVVLLDGRVVGCAAGGVEEGSGHVHTLGVDPTAQGRGLGRALMVALLEALAERGAGPVVLEVRASNGAARGLYASLGFATADRLPAYYPDGEDAWLMVRPATAGRLRPHPGPLPEGEGTHSGRAGTRASLLPVGEGQDEGVPMGGAGTRSLAPAVVLDTNVFVAAGFRPRSASARLVEAVRAGRLRMVWSEATRDEVRRVLARIPRLAWAPVEPLFRPEARFAGPTEPERFGHVPDPADRHFAALADAALAALVTSDDHLLRGRGQARHPIETPGEFERAHGLD